MYRILVHQYFWQFSAIPDVAAGNRGPVPTWRYSVATNRMTAAYGGVNLAHNGKYVTGYETSAQPSLC